MEFYRGGRLMYLESRQVRALNEKTTAPHTQSESTQHNAVAVFSVALHTETAKAAPQSTSTTKYQTCNHSSIKCHPKDPGHASPALLQQGNWHDPSCPLLSRKFDKQAVQLI